jgi:DNA mismatch repair ATPase MutS
MEFDPINDLTNNPYMIMDSQAIENLEITETVANGV